MKLFKVFKALVIFSLLFTSQIISQEAKVLPPGPDENDECSFNEIGEMFQFYYKFYFDLYYSPESPFCDWNILKKYHKCQDIFSELLEKERKRLTKDFNINNSKSGINKGIVIAYGRYIPQPYEITVDNQNVTLMINGVQIWPLLRPANLDESSYDIMFTDLAISYSNFQKAVDLYKQKYTSIINNVLEWYIKHKEKEEAKTFLKEYLERLKNATVIEDYIIYGEDNLQYEIFFCHSWGKFYPGETIESKKLEFIRKKQILSDKGNGSEFETNQKKSIELENKKLFLKNTIGQISDLLNNNEIVFFSTTYGDMYPYNTVTPTKITEICNTIMSNNSDYQKLILLKGSDNPYSHYGLAKELIFNLHSDDCKEILEKLYQEGNKK